MAREVKIKTATGEYKPVNLGENFKLGETLDLSKKSGEDIIRETREYELITPLFGGGAKTKNADEISVIRATEIRGHLRFWWRATRGGRFGGDLTEMKKYEDAIFGSTSNLSALQIEVLTERDYRTRYEKNQELKQWTYKKIRKLDGTPQTLPSESVRDFQYIAFPLQPESNDEPGWQSELSVRVRFKIAISYPTKFQIWSKEQNGNLARDIRGHHMIEKSFNSEIQAALWAWGVFGGIGARTRRGFGALKLIKKNDIACQDEMFVSNDKLFESVRSFVIGGKAPRAVPYLDRNLRLVVFDLSANVIETWKALVSKLKEFRQQRKTKQKRDSNGHLEKDRKGNVIYVPCRSEWNEPEYIRELTNQRLAKHGKIGRLQIEKFPRAAFGMPIEFKFKKHDTWEKNKHGIKSDDPSFDPRKTSLIPTGFERFSSPLILRPISRADHTAVGIALILENAQSIDEIGLTLMSRDHPKGEIRSGLISGLDEAAKEHEQIKAIDGADLLSTGDVHLPRGVQNRGQV